MKYYTGNMTILLLQNRRYNSIIYIMWSANIQTFILYTKRHV